VVLSKAFAGARMNSWLLMQVPIPEGQLKGTATLSQVYSLLVSLQTLAGVTARKRSCVRCFFPNVLRSVFGFVLFSSAFAGDKETKVSE